MMDLSEPPKEPAVTRNRDRPSLPQLLLIRGGRRANGTSGFNTFHFVSGMALCEFAKSKKKKNLQPLEIVKKNYNHKCNKKTFSPSWLGMNNIKPLFNVPASFVSSALGFFFFIYVFFLLIWTFGFVPKH